MTVSFRCWVALALLVGTCHHLELAAGDVLSSEACLACPWLDLPLDEWSAERNSTNREVLPWGQVVDLPAIDYRQLAEQLCECVWDAASGGPGPTEAEFVKASGPLLELGGKPFRFAGFNAQQALSWAASGNPRLLSDLHSLLSYAGALGLGVGRLWANGNGPRVRPPFLDQFDRLDPQSDEPPWVYLQPGPGVHNETALQALDQLIELAWSHGVRLTLSLADYVGRFGPSPPGIEPYIQWVAGTLNLTGHTVLEFYTDERVRLLFRHNLCTLANRVSSVSGVKYRDHPAIFAWDLLNEPRCPACPGGNGSSVLTAWADEMSSFMRCVDPNHLVGVGTEGFFGATTPQYLSANPGTWVLCSGVDFAELAGLPDIGYGSAHMYASMRGTWDDASRSTCGWDCVMEWFRRWLGAHFEASSALTGKPFILEEFSAPWAEAQRNQMFSLVQESFAAQWQNATSPAAGAMFWGATVGDHVDWDGWQVRLDSGRSVPAPTGRADELKALMPLEQQQWLAQVDAMQAAFRRQDLEKQCQEEAKRQVPSVFAGYSSNSTLEIVGKLVASASATAAPASEAVRGALGVEASAGPAPTPAEAASAEP